MKTNQDILDELAKQAESLLQEGITEADNLFVKTAAIRTQLSQFKQELQANLDKQNIQQNSSQAK